LITELVEEEKFRSVFFAAVGMGFDTKINDDTRMFMEVNIVFGFDRKKLITIMTIKPGVSVIL